MSTFSGGKETLITLFTKPKSNKLHQNRFTKYLQIILCNNLLCACVFEDAHQGHLNDSNLAM